VAWKGQASAVLMQAIGIRLAAASTLLHPTSRLAAISCQKGHDAGRVCAKHAFNTSRCCCYSWLGKAPLLLVARTPSLSR
jgi:hypothetical protein